MKRRGRENGRCFRFVSRKERLLRLAASAALCCVALVCVWQLIRYAVDDRRAKDASAALRAEYYSLPEETAQPSAPPAETQSPPAAAAAPSPSPQPDTLPAVRYPNKPVRDRQQPVSQAAAAERGYRRLAENRRHA